MCVPFKRQLPASNAMLGIIVTPRPELQEGAVAIVLECRFRLLFEGIYHGVDIFDVSEL